MTATKDLSKHPCFNRDSAGTCGRVHLPVAPKCNIMCNFCNRKYDCVSESRPGVTSAVLSPEQAVGYMIVDLSLTGCQFSAILQTTPPPELHIDDQLELQCELFSCGEPARLPAVVKRVGVSEKRVELGLKFKEIAEETRTAIAGYLHNALLVLD